MCDGSIPCSNNPFAVLSVDTTDVQLQEACMPAAECVQLQVASVPAAGSSASKLASEVVTRHVSTKARMPIVKKLPAFLQQKTACAQKKLNNDSVMAFLSVLHVRTETQLLATLPFVNGKTRMSRPVLDLPQKPVVHFHQLNAEQIASLQQMTQHFTYVSNNSITDFYCKHAGHQHLLLSPKEESLAHCTKAIKNMLSDNPSSTLVIALPLSVDFNFMRGKEGWSKIYKDDNIHAFTNHKTQEDIIPFVSERQTMSVPVRIIRTECQVLLDSGASGTGFVTQKFCADHKLHTYSVRKTSVILGDNSKVSSCRVAQVPIQIGTYKYLTKCLILPDIPEYPVILGSPWLKTHKVKMDFESDSVTMRKGSKTFTLHLRNPTSKDTVSLAHLSTTEKAEGEGGSSWKHMLSMSGQS